MVNDVLEVLGVTTWMSGVSLPAMSVSPRSQGTIAGVEGCGRLWRTRFTLLPCYYLAPYGQWPLVLSLEDIGLSLLLPGFWWRKLDSWVLMLLLPLPCSIVWGPHPDSSIASWWAGSVAWTTASRNQVYGHHPCASFFVLPPLFPIHPPLEVPMCGSLWFAVCLAKETRLGQLIHN